MRHLSPTRPAAPFSSRLSPAGRALAACIALAGLAGTASAATQTFNGSFTGAGGDATAGWGPGGTDWNVNLFGIGAVPLFDPALGVLERVSFTLSGWRSLSGDCSVPANAEGGGSCSARIDGAFFLEANNPVNTPLATVPMASINPVQLNFSVVSPGVGESIPLNLVESRSTSGEITHAAQLASHFTDLGLPPTLAGIVIRFSPQDGGYYGMGASAGWSRLQWNADASYSVSYHYAAAVPEPSAWAMLAAGLALVGGLARRRRPG